MAIRKRKPTSPGRRFQTVSDFAEITKRRPRSRCWHPSTRPVAATTTAARPHATAAVVTSAVPHRRLPSGQGRRAGQGRRRSSTTPTATAASPCCTTPTARSATSWPPTGSRSATVSSGHGSDIRPGNALPLRYIPVGTNGAQRRAQARWRRQDGPLGRHRRPARGQGGRLRHRAPAQHRDASSADRLPGHRREVGNAEAELIKIGKAGRNRWKGKRPQTRGVAMNPVDHPHGGGEGKTSGGRHPVSPWGKPEGRTRKKNK